jgi:hypothetical protein
MDTGLRKVIGNTVFETRDLLIEATKVQSVVARELYLKAIMDKMAAKEAARITEYQQTGLSLEDATKKARKELASEFLTKVELNEVFDSLRDVMPLVESDGQYFQIAKDALLNFWNQAGEKQALWQYSRSLDEEYRTVPYATGVENAGVSAIPYLTIGMGDARMVRKIFETALMNVMQVYDGVNIPVDRIQEYGARINKAAMHAWQGNVLGSVAKTFRAFTENAQVQAIFEQANGEGNNPVISKILKSLEEDKVSIQGMTSILDLLESGAQSQEARRRVLNRAPKSMDQMAGTYQPDVTTGFDIPEGASTAEVAAILTVEYYKELEQIQQEEQDRRNNVRPTVRKKLAPPGTPKNATKLSFSDILTNDTFEGEQRELLHALLKSEALKDTKIVSGTFEQLVQHQIENFGTSSIADNLRDQSIGGIFSPTENTIYLLNTTGETILHEAIHAATYKTLEAYYSKHKLGKEMVRVKNAVQRLEQLMNLFMTDDTIGQEDALSEATTSKVKGIINEYLAAGDAVGKAGALNEFMAWTLSNQDLAEALSSKLDTRFTKLVKATVAAFKRLVSAITGAKAESKMSFFKAVRYNTEIIAHSQARISFTKDLEALLLAQDTTGNLQNVRLGRLLETFDRKIASNLTQNSPDLASRLDAHGNLRKYAEKVDELTAAADFLFSMSEEERQVFHMMVAGLATEAQINPHMMIEAQKIFDHFLNNLTQQDFMTGHRNYQYDADQANDKFQFISGHTLRHTDTLGRSSMLPVFLALATVSENFRKVLATKNILSAQNEDVVGLDSALEVIADKALTELGNTLSGTNHPENVKVAIDQLTDKLVNTTLKSRSAIDDKLEMLGKGSAGVNARMVKLLQRVGTVSYRAGHTLQQSSSSFKRALGAALKALSFVSSDENVKVIEEGILKFMDEHPNTWEWVKEFVTDLVGRVESQGNIYDMLKRTRATAAQTRQAFRDNVPRVILGKFKHNKPSTTQLDTFYNVMGRFDMASLVSGSRGVKETLALVTDRQALDQEVIRLGHALQVSNPHQATKYQTKIDQYVNYVKTGIRGPALLRNAHAIAELLHEPKNETWVPPTLETVRVIDQLITLKLLAKMSENDMLTLTEFNRDEPEAMQFMLSYLRGQRVTELTKVQSGPARLNHYKGELPSDNLEGGHLVVKPDTEHESMIDRSYIRVGKFTGSNIESGGPSMSYYYSPNSGAKTAFNQGVAQNVQQTAYGVLVSNGYSLNATAGRITDPVKVTYLARRMHLEVPSAENLSPVFGKDGQVVAFERSLDAKQVERTQRPQNLAAMLGHWRGRQVEETWGAKINRELLNELFSTYTQDINENPANENTYINVFESTDPIIRDAVSILPGELKVLAAERFGENRLMVRRHMVNMVIGYRSASVADLWTNNTRWGKDTQEALKKAFTTVFGSEAYRILVKAEQNWQATMASVRTNIVVRSLVVPAANFMSGVFQLGVRGIGPLTVAKAIPGKVAEIEFYTKTMRDKVALEAERWAYENNIHKVRAIDARLKTMEDSLKHLSIWPLIEAGEFSTIADVGQTAEELGAGPNNIMDTLSRAIDQLPGGLRDAARQGYFARDTAIFQALQKSVQYSDFVMKSIYFDHLTKKENLPKAAAKARVTEEFVNYDLPTGRTRGYLENAGLVWFMNFKIRSTKIALSMMRNNPLGLLLYSVAPGSILADIPFTDNLFSKIFEGTIGYSIGPGMATNAMSINPVLGLAVNAL